jgi:succinoglycan biosynthesis protein ExoO
MSDLHIQRGPASSVLRPVLDRQEHLVSVIMANLNGQAYLRRAIRSVMNQTHSNLELVIADDGSVDDSCRIIREEMGLDPRIKLIGSSTSRGPASARNRALAVASGDWIAIVDSDDIIHPERLGRMVWSAVALKSDIVADDIIFFGNNPSERNKTLLQDLHLDGPLTIDAVTLVSGCLRGARSISLGYLKPVIRKTALGDLRFNETLRIDEDHDLYLRLLMSGASFTLIPDAMYLYRRHAASASYRLSAAKLRLMIAAQEAFQHQLPPQMKDLSRAVHKRLARARDQLIYVGIVDALKAGDKRGAAGSLLRHPRTVILLLRSLQERLARRFHRSATLRTRMKIVLGLRNQTRVSDYPDATIIHVPEVAAKGWLPSAASTWAYLAHLSCEQDLDIIAIDRAGIYALGLVPRMMSVDVVQSHQSTGGADMHIASVAQTAAEGT